MLRTPTCAILCNNDQSQTLSIVPADPSWSQLTVEVLASPRKELYHKTFFAKPEIDSSTNAAKLSLDILLTDKSDSSVNGTFWRIAYEPDSSLPLKIVVMTEEKLVIVDEVLDMKGYLVKDVRRHSSLKA